MSQAEPPGFDSLKTEAETYYAEGSYSRAYEIYSRIHAMKLSSENLRWVNFRLADTLWRSHAASSTAEESDFNQAEKQLEALTENMEEKDQDQVWAEVQESLGDFYWIRPDHADQSTAWSYYSQALEWWAGAPDIELARQRYIAIVWKAATPPQRQGTYYSNLVPVEILDNIPTITENANDCARAHYLIAKQLSEQPQLTPEMVRRVPEEFEHVLQYGKVTEWYDDTLRGYALWLSGFNEQDRTRGTAQGRKLDYAKALALFQRLTNEFQKGETPYYDEARSRIQEITLPSLFAGVSNIFLPESEIRLNLRWRNLSRIDFALYKVDLLNEAKPAAYQQLTASLRSMDLLSLTPVQSWSRETGDKGDYLPVTETVALKDKLPVGSYMLEATSGKLKSRDLIMVTDVTVLLKITSKKALAYVSNALDGSPVPNAGLKIWEQNYVQQQPVIVEQTNQTNKDGICVFDLTDPQHNAGFLVIAGSGERQAFGAGKLSRNYQEPESWRIYAFTDRPAYRPGETAQWKLIARKYDGSFYSTPSNESIEYEITDPRGAKVRTDKITLNGFGSAWGSFPLTDTMALGAYGISFWNEGRSKTIGFATLFRLEEYKLPEFKVAVLAPQENGEKKAFRPGENVDITVQSDYYFGSPVFNARVELLIYQGFFSPSWQPEPDYPWLSAEVYPNRNYGSSYGGATIRKILTTDASGKAVYTLQTPKYPQHDLQYRVEARVTDASRRENVAEETINVTRQRYFAYAIPEHNVYHPGDKVLIRFRTLDANNHPVSEEGTIRIARNAWKEEIRKYDRREILSARIKTDAKGHADFSFTPPQDGYYGISLNSIDTELVPVQSETFVWVAGAATTELGYRHGGLEMILDRDRVEPGKRAAVILMAPDANRYILFTVEGEDLYHYELVHLTGMAKLVEFDVEDKQVPNVFLNASMISNSQIFRSQSLLLVPPEKQLLQLHVALDRDEYKPRDQGTITVTALDFQGKPVSSDVALGVIDESVYTIQEDYAPDPRQFYFGTKRGNRVSEQSTFALLKYARFYSEQERQKAKGQVKISSGKRKGDGNSVATLEGVVTDENGAAIPGVIVTAEAPGVDSRSTYSGANGMFRLSGLLPATYTITFRLAGFAEIRQESIEISIDDDVHLEITMRPSLEEQVAVAAEVAAVTTQASSTEYLTPLPRGWVYDMDSFQRIQSDSLVTVRSDFRTTAFWQPDLKTDTNGKVSVTVKFPDSVTTWKATARAATQSSQFGIATSSSRTNQPLIVRLESPRFFVVGDTVTLSAIVNNNVNSRLQTKVSLEAEGFTLQEKSDPTIELEPNGEKRIDWVAFVSKPGTAKLRVSALSDEYSDAMERSLPVYEHGIEKLITKSGKVQGNGVTVNVLLPRERKPETTSLTIQVAPSLAIAMLDAVPYLVHYPYGCTEQTMSRFLPAIIVQKTLSDLGAEPEMLASRMFQGIEPQYAKNTHPEGKQEFQQLEEIVKLSLNRLYNLQNATGGWGWWKDGSDDRFMTGYVVWGLGIARDAGVAIDPSVLNRATAFLDQQLVPEENPFEEQAWMLHAVTSITKQDANENQKKTFRTLWGRRREMNSYSRALLALTANYLGDSEKSKVLARNLEDGVKIDGKPDTSMVLRAPQVSQNTSIGTAHWGSDAIRPRWQDSAVGTTSFVLRALLMIDSRNKLIEPAVNWLIKNRRGAQWSSTLDTAVVILTLNDYLKQSDEAKTIRSMLSSDPKERAMAFDFELNVNGMPVPHNTSGEAPGVVRIDPKLVRDGNNTIHIVRKSSGHPLYYSVQSGFFSLEEPVAATGNQIFVRRQYYRITGRPSLLHGYVYDKHSLKNGELLRSGDRLQVVITIESKNNYEYLLFEDLKPAGLEATTLQSGAFLTALRWNLESPVRDSDEFEPQQDGAGESIPVYQELRDRKVALFVQQLPEGIWQISYDLRAEVPGKFHGLPVIGYAMYVPEIRGNDTEVPVEISEP